MNTTARTLIAVGFISFLSSCTLPLNVDFYNDLEREVKISFKNEDHRVALIEVGKHEKVTIRSLFDGRFQIDNGRQALKYTRPDVPVDHVEYVGTWPFTKRLIHVRLRDDMCIYIESKNVQPEGFPLCGTSP